MQCGLCDESRTTHIPTICGAACVHTHVAVFKNDSGATNAPAAVHSGTQPQPPGAEGGHERDVEKLRTWKFLMVTPRSVAGDLRSRTRLCFAHVKVLGSAIAIEMARVGWPWVTMGGHGWPSENSHGWPRDGEE